MKPRYLKLMPPSPLRNASRNKREMDTAYAVGFAVSLAAGSVTDNDMTPEIRRYQVSSYQSKPPLLPNSRISRKLNHLYNRLRLRRFVLRQIRITRPAVISCEDLHNLQLAWQCTRYWEKKPQLIYDSHEFEIGRRGQRTPSQQRKVIRKERRLMARCAFSIMVNDSIADEVMRVHGLTDRPVVLRSTPPNWTLDPAAISAQRQAFLHQLNAPQDAFLALYHGNLLSQRGIEQLIGAVQRNSALYGIVLGDAVGGEYYLEHLKKLCIQVGVADRVLFHPGVSIDVLWRYVGAADIGVMLIEDSCPSYYLSLPNKFLECVQSLTPIICSDFPEMRRLVDEYGIGLCVQPHDEQALDQALVEICQDAHLRAQLQQGLIRAKKELCWEKEKNKLLNAFTAYLHSSSLPKVDGLEGGS